MPFEYGTEQLVELFDDTTASLCEAPEDEFGFGLTGKEVYLFNLTGIHPSKGNIGV